MKKARLVRVLVIALLGIFMSWGVSVLAQDVESGPPTTTTITERAIPEQAKTTQNPDIAVEDLKLIIKPLTLEELDHEAASWLLLLKDKVQQISNDEIAIKLENRAIEAEKASIRKLELANQELVTAEANHSQTAPNTPEHVQTRQELQQARKNLRKATLDIETIEKEQAKLEQNFTLRQALQEVKQEYTIQLANNALERAYKALEDKPDLKGQPLYKQFEVQLSNLEKSKSSLEKVEDALQNIAPRVEDALQNIAPRSEARQALQEQEQELIQTVAENTQELQQTISSLLTTETETDFDRAIRELEQKAEAQQELKKLLALEVADLEAQKSGLAERLGVILDEIDNKGGDSNSYRRYIRAVSGIELDVKDREGLGIKIKSWLTSDQGGLRLVSIVARVLGIALGFFLFGLLVDRLYLALQNSILKSFLEPQIIPVLQTIGRLTIWVTVIILALNTIGLEIGTILAGLGIGGFAIALAAQDTLSNILGGFTLLLQRKVALGQRVEVGGIKAKVKEIGLRTTTLVELDYGYQVVVPNNKFLKEVVKYIDSRPNYAIYQELYLDHGSSFEQINLALELIKQVAANNEYIQGSRPSFTGFNDRGLQIKFVFWIEKWQATEREIFPNDLWKIYTVRSQMNHTLLEQYDKHNLKLALPILSLKQVPQDAKNNLLKFKQVNSKK